MTVPLLHNMSTRPRTQVQARIAPLGGAIARFALADVEASSFLNAAGCTAKLEAAWQSCGLRGVCHVYPWRESQAETPAVVVRVRDVRLVLNVLGRARSQLLLASAPLELEDGFLARELASDDPRLVALARRHGRGAR